MLFRRFVWTGVALAALSGCNPDVDDLKRGDKEILAKIDAVQKSLEQARGAGAKAAAEPTPDPSKVYDIPLEKSPVRGPKNAPVTIVEFSDFQCPFCGRVEPTLKQIEDEYKGKVRIAWKNQPLSFHPNAMPAAEAAMAAFEQGNDKFWAMHEKFFANQNQLSPAYYEQV